MIDQQHLDLAAIICVHGTGRIEHRDAVIARKTGARTHLRFGAGRQRDGDAGGHGGILPRRNHQRHVGGHGGEQIEPRGTGALIGGQRQVGAVRQPQDTHGDLAHRDVPPIASAMRTASVAATSSFDCVGQCSTPIAVTRWIVLLSPPITPLSADTSLARIQSQPLRLSFALACSTTFSVSAANPTTSVGRFDFSFETVARMSGFSTSASFGGPLPSFCSFCSPASAVRQSATAAAKMPTSAGSADSTARSMSRALSTWMVLTPAGSGKFTGPVTSVTVAPAAAAARAIACPCFPEDRFAM